MSGQIEKGRKKAKMLGATKEFGRCSTPGHGSNGEYVCVVNHEIQTKSISRSRDKRPFKETWMEEYMEDLEILDELE